MKMSSKSGIPDPPLESEMKISIIIPTCNRCEKLKFLLDSLKNMCIPDAVKCEVLVIDNNSTDSTKQVKAEYLFSENLMFKYFFEKRQGKSYALNTGIREAKGEILAFTDDDCVPDPNWIESIGKEFEQDPSLSVLGGRVELYDKEDISHAVSLSKKRLQISHPKEVCQQPLIMGGNMAIRRNIFDIVPEFDPLLGPGSICRAAEDMELLYRVCKKGFKMVYSPEVLVFHNHGRKTQAEDDTLARDYGMGRGGLYFKHILQADMDMLKIAGREIYGLSKTLLKGLIVGENFPYHKITFPSLFLGASYYYKASSFKEKPSRKTNL